MYTSLGVERVEQVGEVDVPAWLGMKAWDAWWYPDRPEERTTHVAHKPWLEVGVVYLQPVPGAGSGVQHVP
jgi:hypothetical protein